MRQGPMRSIIARITGSAFLRWVTALRMLYISNTKPSQGRKENEFRQPAIAFCLEASFAITALECVREEAGNRCVYVEGRWCH
jgi:hypothetical protein